MNDVGEDARKPFANRLCFYGFVYLCWMAVVYLLTGGTADWRGWVESWARWDVFWYDRIWDEWYTAKDPQPLAFPPGYALLTGALAQALHASRYLVAMALNTVAFLASAVLFVELMAKRMRVSPRALFCLALTSPTAYFAFPAYSDALFSLVLWSLLYLALLYPDSIRARIAQGLLLLAAPWLRLTGYSFAAWLLLKRWAALFVFVSLAGWLYINYRVTHDTFYFLKAQHLYAMGEGNIFDGIRYTVRGLYTFGGLLPVGLTDSQDNWVDYLQFHLLPLLYFVALAATAIWFCARGEWLIGVTMLSVLVMSHNQQFWRSALRYDWPLMPCLFVPLLAIAERRGNAFSTGILCGIIASAQCVMQGFFGSLFHAGRWGF